MKVKKAQEIFDAVKMGDFTLVRPDSFGYDANRVHYNKTGRLIVVGHSKEVKQVLEGGVKQVGRLNKENAKLRKRLGEYKQLLSAYEKSLPLQKSVEGTGETMVGYVVSHPTTSNRKKRRMLHTER